MSDRITKWSYREEIRDIAKDIKEEICEHGGDVYDRIHETVDSHQWVIYTGYHYEVLAASDNADAGFEEGLIDAGSAAREGTLSMQQAFCAMQADLMEEIGDWKPAECPNCCGREFVDEEEAEEHAGPDGDCAEKEPEDHAE